MLQQLPAAFIDSLQAAKGFDEEAFVQAHQPGRQIVSVRMNPAKFNTHALSFIHKGRVPWSSSGYYLTERPSFTLDPLFHAGAYYVQEASSMFLEEALRQSGNLTNPLKILDLCASPGGKSTLLQSVISDESLLVSNEVIKTRANILAENITKWGAANVIVTNNDPKDFQRLPGFFDVIVADAPCSGSGLFRKEPQAIDEWSPGNVDLCSQRQQRILADVLPSLKSGGTLIYSTCSYSQSEDEDICDWLLSQQEHKLYALALHINNEWGITETISKSKAYGYRFYPDKVKGEGLFIAVFKKENDDLPAAKIKSTAKSVVNESDKEILRQYINNESQFIFIKLKNEVLAFPHILYEDLLLLKSTLYLKKAGVKLGVIIRNELIPDHELAMSTIASDYIPSLNISKELALDYLRRKDIHLSTHIRGWAILKYMDLSLGLVKILPNRINNYYPKEWRIINK